MRKAQSETLYSDAVEAEASGNTEKAIEEYREALKLDPTSALLAYRLAMLLDKKGDAVSERAVLEQAVSNNPRMAVAYNQIGYLAFSGGDNKTAIQEFMRAVQIDPGYTKAWMNLAAAYCVESEFGKAREAVGHVLEIDPSDPRARELAARLEPVGTQR